MSHARVGDTIAAIDLGSNSFHLAIARILENRVQMLHRIKQRVQLAQGMDQQGNLADDAIERGLDCLRQFAQHLVASDISDIRVVATYALRSAPNRQRFVQPAEQILATPVEVIAGSEEARLIFQGVAQSLELDGNSLVIDIGGGSTELIIGQGRSPKLMESVNMGCVSFHDRFFATNKLSSKGVNRAIVAAQQQLEPLLERYHRLGWQQVIGCSGTIKALQQLCSDGDQSQPLEREQLEQLRQQLIDGHPATTDALNQLPESRRKVIPAGLAVLLACFRSLELTPLRFSSAALREGVIVEMAGEQDHDSICRETVAAMERLHHVDTSHGKQVAKSASAFFKSSPCHNAPMQRLLKWAARLLEVGLSLNFRGMHRHSGYILSNSNLPGFTVEQQQLLGWLGRFQRKRLDECQPLLLQLADPLSQQHLLVSLRLAALWHLGRRHQMAMPNVHWHPNKLVLSLPFNSDEEPLLWADLEQEQRQLQQIDWQLELHQRPPAAH
ncbi:exopolyphosphatase [uncultured Ferrimonas sp.]|uniref:exopolyphosphatase n=1 Tax=uncultured Ferrimonas sp. TaxID=432640 RepID=UPI00261EE1C5|nr:exopolyphosphatase [uncultured Ferrimonas sp.]